MKITIVGAGISGLATAYILAKQKHTIKVIAKDFTPNITSNRAAAFWFPYHIRNDERGIHWCKRSYEVYKEFSGNFSCGVSMQKLLKVVRQGVEEAELTWFSFMPEGSYPVLTKMHRRDCCYPPVACVLLSFLFPYVQYLFQLRLLQWQFRVRLKILL